MFSASPIKPFGLPRPRPLVEICNDTLQRLLDNIAEYHAHSIEHAIVAADHRSKTLLLVILLPDRFRALQADTSGIVESNGVEYPIIVVIEAGAIRLLCPDQVWTDFFAPDGCTLKVEPKLKNEVAFRRVELVESLVKLRLEESRARAKKRRDEKKGEQQETTDQDTTEETVTQRGQDQPTEAQQDEVDEDNLRARKRKRRREKEKRQRARRREETERARELKQLESEVIQDGVTPEELSRGFKTVEVGSEEYFDELANAKELGLKVVRARASDVSDWRG